MKRATSSLVAGLAATVIILACEAGPGRVAAPTFPVAPSTTALEDTSNCGPDIPESECSLAGSGERWEMFFDVQAGIKWEDPGCAAIGYTIQDHILYGLVYTYPNAQGRRWGGTWTGGGKPKRVAYNALLFQQGWTNERTKTSIHEGVHVGGQVGPASEDSAESWAQWCVNN